MADIDMVVNNKKNIDIDINMEIQFGERVGHRGLETCEYKSLKVSHILYKKKNRTEQSRALPQHKLNSRASASSSQAQAHVHDALSAREKYNLLSFCPSTLLLFQPRNGSIPANLLSVTNWKPILHTQHIKYTLIGKASL